MITLGLRQKASNGPRRPRTRIRLFLKMCEQIVEFVRRHDRRDFEVYFALDGDSLNLYLMTKAEVYDFTLSGKLAEFAAPYIERGLLDSATLLPASTPEELAAFFDPETAVMVEIRHA